MRIDKRISHVHFVSQDQLLYHQVEAYLNKYTECFSTRSTAVTIPPNVDVVCIPADKIEEYFALAHRFVHMAWIPIVAYGSRTIASSCLFAGCHDYLSDRWTMDEMWARVSRLISVPLYRSAKAVARLTPCGITANLSTIPLSFPEYRVLKLCANNYNQSVPREAFAYVIGDEDMKIHEALVNIYVSGLRKKLRYLSAEIKMNCILEAIRNVGYRFYICPADVSKFLW